jgi:hypothetical protein
VPSEPPRQHRSDQPEQDDSSSSSADSDSQGSGSGSDSKGSGGGSDSTSSNTKASGGGSGSDSNAEGGSGSDGEGGGGSNNNSSNSSSEGEDTDEDEGPVANSTPRKKSATTPRKKSAANAAVDSNSSDDDATTPILRKTQPPVSAMHDNGHGDDSNIPTLTPSVVQVNTGPATADAHAPSVPDTPIGVILGANPSIPGDIDVDMASPMHERDPALFDGKFLFFPFIFYINIYMLLEPDLDVEIDPQGSSRSHGGHLRGNARGNNFNFADRHEHRTEDLEKLPVTGYVNYYLSDCDPSTLTDIYAAKPSGSFQHTKQNTVGPILTRLVRLYPSVKKMEDKI